MSEALKRGRCIDPCGEEDQRQEASYSRRYGRTVVAALVHPVHIQDRDGGILVLKTLFGRYPFLKKLFADGGYQEPVFAKGQKKAVPRLMTEIIKRSNTAKGFEALPRRWVVE